MTVKNQKPGQLLTQRKRKDSFNRQKDIKQTEIHSEEQNQICKNNKENRDFNQINQQQQKQKIAKKIVHLQENNIPQSQQYKFINRGYRVYRHYGNKRSFLKSLFELHNETVNIWSHFIGAIFMIIFLVSCFFLYDHYSEIPFFQLVQYISRYNSEVFFAAVHKLEDSLLEMKHFEKLSEEQLQVAFYPVYILMFTAFACLSLSSIYHTFHPVSDKAGRILQRADYSGINLLIVGSSWALYYYGFYCHQNIFYFYMTVITIINILVFTVALQDFIYSEAYIQLKNWLYFICGTCSFLPAVHLFIYENYYSSSPYTSLTSLPFYIMTGLCYGVGLYIYAKKWPECKKPNKYDVCGASHQIWHFFVLLAIFFTIIGSITNYELRLNYTECNV
ncbi:hypothetical protein PPERSA_00255 [Pseudocohnilembus persalinus]|uniref:Uncharacterized protein n=1 Tax=Pseudocohnilembus persalinus TaxID=266149 RepID=A0A0V0Q920_PSEPJ|nr:hypothetical protein PPERSA_00255 [Pseudocohnilembus persalinus]|eukprot:KRW98667.1 hypothetical protein PPERSA_00255 [Pseudocohnilembus persalinus]